MQEAFGALHGHQIKALNDAVLAMAAAGHCGLARVAAVRLNGAKAPSQERRWQRLVANGRIDVAACAKRWAALLLASAVQAVLMLDETPQHNHLRAMKISLQVRGRAVPLLWWCRRPHQLPMSQRRIVLDLLERVARLLPPGARPTLLTDRGLAWPAVVDFCRGHGWHYELRIQGQTRARVGHVVLAVRNSAPKLGARWYGTAQVFKKAGWRTTNLVAYWKPGTKEAWLLVTDLPPSLHRCNPYRKRMRQEQSFRDEKSQGFQWSHSRIRNPDHAMRLLLIMAIAMSLLIRLGVRIARGAARTELERPSRRVYSVFQLGLRFVHRYARPMDFLALPICVGK
ncbi:MAG: transposase [Candidatus Lambdaproteobacteria bacterium]|nr:transposase [Candidatus Lambdaproteobacteria bacterium]